jgi:hypothetical protein
MIARVAVAGLLKGVVNAPDFSQPATPMDSTRMHGISRRRLHITPVEQNPALVGERKRGCLRLRRSGVVTSALRP